MQRRMHDECNSQTDKEVDPEYVIPAAVDGSAAHLPCEAGEHWPNSHRPVCVQEHKHELEIFGLSCCSRVAEGRRESGKEKKDLRTTLRGHAN